MGDTDLSYKNTYDHFLRYAKSDKNHIKYKEYIINAEFSYKAMNNIYL